MEHEHCEHQHCNHSHSHDGIKSKIHDGAVVISAEREIQGSIKVIKDKLEMEIKNLAKWVEEKDGIVGHIKAYIKSEGLAYMLSYTAEEVQLKEVPPINIHVSLTAIVFNVDIHEMECRSAEVLEII